MIGLAPQRFLSKRQMQERRARRNGSESFS
jgi:hypothetical protein